jgi:hypothetical protein
MTQGSNTITKTTTLKALTETDPLIDISWVKRMINDGEIIRPIGKISSGVTQVQWNAPDLIVQTLESANLAKISGFSYNKSPYTIDFIATYDQTKTVKASITVEVN